MATVGSLTVADFQAQAAAGIHDGDARVELLGGEIRNMSPIGIRHAAAVNRLVRLFGRGLAADLMLSVQNSVVLSEVSQPQPDLAIADARADD